MERTSQVVLRNASRLPAGAILLVNPPRDELFRQLARDGRRVPISTQDHGDYRWLVARGASAVFETVPGAPGDCEAVILHLPREKDRLNLLLHGISSRMPDEAKLWLVGENQAGIKSAGKHLDAWFGSVGRLDNARHCGLYVAGGPIRGTPFELDAYETTWKAVYAGKILDVVSLPGVFAHGRLDPGSRLLLEVLERLAPRGRILDFACGSGVIGCSLLAAEADAELTLLDVSAPAIDSSRRTLERNGLQATLLASDGLAELTGTYDWIVSNPPFHRGVSNDLDIASRFFSAAGTFLANRGKIVIVCNRHLPYTGWLQNHFEQVELLDENDGFAVIQAGSPRKG